MPTAGRLAGALSFAILGLVIAFTTMPLFQEGLAPDFWFPLCALAGLWVGWVIVGPKAGAGFSDIVGISLSGVAVQVFWILLFLSGYDMIRKSMRRSYDGPIEAVINAFEIAGNYALQFATFEVMTTVVAGGVVAGLVTELFARLYPH